ncbi:MAG: YgiQ family radical SAM protein [Lentisphaeria bacterium]
MTRAEMTVRGWDALDVLLVTGDAYVDHPSFGIAVIGRVLEADGWRVGVVAQPDWRDPAALAGMGVPKLFCGVAAGNLDSMLANHTAARHRRHEDDFSPGGRAGLRPDHACMVYAQLARRAFPGVPVILGGVEASLRRVAHYDYWEDKARPSILADAKADLLVYGMGEAAIRETARRLYGRPAGRPYAAGTALAGIPGTARLLGAAESGPRNVPTEVTDDVGNPLLRKGGSQTLRQTCLLPFADSAGRPTVSLMVGCSKRPAESANGNKRFGKGLGEHPFPKGWPQQSDFPPAGGDEVLLPDWEAVRARPELLLEQTRLVEAEQSPFCGRRLRQWHGARALIVEPPAPPLPPAELDWIYALPFSRRPHPSYRERIPAFDMIRDSVTVVRGCPGGCSFCGLGLHQGRFLASRSPESVQAEIARLAGDPEFHGTVTDVGGPTANLYGSANGVAAACRSCRRPSCLFPEICPHFKIADAEAANLLRRAAAVPGVKHVFVQSGVRMDVALRQPEYVRELVRHHVSGHLKVAPEHRHPAVLRRMRKPGPEVFDRFQEAFSRESRAAGKEQYLVPYFISSFPGCTQVEMRVVEEFLRQSNWNLQQAQDFIPLPMTPAAAMYVSGRDYLSGAPIPVARGAGERLRQFAGFRPGRGPRPNGKTEKREKERR